MPKKLLLLSLSLCVAFFLVIFVLLFSFTPKEESNTDVNLNHPQGQVANAIIKAARQEGGTDVGIASFLGVLEQESGLRPDAIQSNLPYNKGKALNPSVGGYAFGLVQWDSGRRVNLLNFAERNKKKWQDVNLQMDFAFGQEKSDSALLKELIKGKDLEKTVARLTTEYERAGAAHIERRIAYAKAWLSMMQEGENSSGGSSLIEVPKGWTLDKPIKTSHYQAITYPQGQCTWFTWNRAKEFGIAFDPYMGNGQDWMNKAGFKVTGTPTKHAAVSFKVGQLDADPTYGHVAFVEGIKADGSVLISEANVVQGVPYSFRVLSKAEAGQLQYVIGK